jgi:NAD(P)H-quinone oxidoreductase subunit I
MKAATMLGDVLRSVLLRPATRQYPRERQAITERLRGKLHWDPAQCTGCALCVKDCPAQAIELITVDKAAKRFVLHYHADRCAYCAQCVQSCRFGCITLSNSEWELAALDKPPFSMYYGNQADVDSVLANLPPAGVETSAKT